MKTLLAAVLVLGLGSAAVAGDKKAPAKKEMGAGMPGHMMNGVLVDAKGMTLYTFDNDKDGKSSCSGPCAENWPPLKADAAAKGSGDWTIIAREDGSKQWAYKGKPVYGWVKDQKVGDTTGDGVKGVWHVVK